MQHLTFSCNIFPAHTAKFFSYNDLMELKKYDNFSIGAEPGFDKYDMYSIK